MNIDLRFNPKASFVCVLATLAGLLGIGESPSEAHAEMRVGISAFGIQSNNFQGSICNNFLEAISQSPHPSIAILYNTFGKNNRCLERFWSETAAAGKRHLTEIHFSNEAGRRIGNLDTNDFQSRFTVTQYNSLLERMPEFLERDIRIRLQGIKNLIGPYLSGGEFILSTGLEDNYTTQAWENLYRIIQSEWYGPIARSRVYNKWSRKQIWHRPPGVYNELHGYKKGLGTQAPCIVNGDGQDVTFLAGSGINFSHARAASPARVMGWIDKATAKGCITFLWAAKWQGFFGAGTPPPPLKRKFRFDREDIILVEAFLLRPFGAIKPRKSIRRLRKLARSR